MILDEFVALDTNEYVFAIRDVERQRPSARILFGYLDQMRIYFPLQIQSECRHNLTDEEVGHIFEAFEEAIEVRHDYSQPPSERIAYWESQGAKKGDAVICASLEDAGVKYLISENRHFLAQIENLPFAVLSAQQLLDLLFPP